MSVQHDQTPMPSTPSAGLPRQHARSLRHVLASHFAAFALLPVVAGGLLVVIGGAWLLQAQVFAHLQSVANAAAQELQYVCDDTLKDFDRFSQREHVRRATAALLSTEATSAEKAYWKAQLIRQFEQLLPVMVHDGESIILVPLDNPRPLVYVGCTASMARTIVKRHSADIPRTPPHATFMDAHQHVNGGTPVVGVSRLVDRPGHQSGELRAMLLWHLPMPSRFYQVIEERADIGRTGEIVFVNRHGLALRDLRYEPGSAFQRIIHAAPAQAAIGGQQGIKVARDYRGAWVVAALGHVPLTGWGIVAKQDAAEAYAGIAHLGLIWLSLILILTFTIRLLSNRLSQRFLRPIEELTAATYRIAAGDLATPITVQRDDELGDLAEHFGRMAERIAASQEALRLNEERLRLALEAADEGLWDWDLANNSISRSPRFYTMLGYEPDGFPNTYEGWAKLVHPDDIASTQQIIDECLAHGDGYEAEFRMHTREGRIIWVSSRGKIVGRAAGGTPTRMVGTHTDITVRKEAEGVREAALAEAQQSRAKLQAALSSMSDAVFISDQNGNLIEFNDAFLVFHRFTDRDHYQRILAADPNWLALGTADGAWTPQVKGPVLRALQGESAANVEYLLRLNETGESWWGSYSFAPIRDAEGRIQGSVVVARDITETKQAAERLRVSEERLRLALEATDEGLWDWDPTDDSAFRSPRFYTMLGYAPREIPDEDDYWRKLIHPEDQERVREAMADGMRQDEPFEVEFRVQSKDRGYVWIQSRARVAARDEAGLPLRVLGTNKDIHDRRVAEVALRKSEHRYRSLFQEMFEGHATHRAITDENGELIDYEFIATNPAFNQLTGLSELEGKLVSEVIPGLRENNPLLFEVYGRVARTGNPEAFQEYIPALGRWYEVAAYRPEPGYFAAVFDDVTGRKLAEEALRQSEQRFRETVDLLPVAVWEANLEGDLTFINRQFTVDLGYTSEDVERGLNSQRDIIAPESLPQSRTRLADLLVGGVTEGREYLLIRKDGSTLPVALFTSLIGSLEAPEGLRGVIVSLEERKRAELALAQSEELLRTTFERASIGQTIRDSQTRLMRANEAVCTILGRSAEEMQDLSLLDITHPDDRAASLEFIESVRASASGTGRLQKRYLRPDGEIVWTEITTSLIRYPDGSPRLYVTHLMDISEQVRARQALADLTSRLQAIIASAPVGICVLDLKEGIQLWNPAMERLLGWTESEVLGQQLPPTIPRELVAHFQQEIQDTIMQGTLVVSHETMRLHRDGTRIPVSVSMAPLFHEDGAISGWVAMVADIRERLRAEREAEERTALDRLVQLTHTLLRESSPAALLNRAVTGVCELVEADVCIVTRHDAMGPQSAGQVAIAADVPGLGPEATCEQAEAYLQRLEDAGSLKLVAQLPRAQRCLRVPLGSDADQPLGELGVGRASGEPFSASDKAVLHELGTFISLALARLETLQNLRDQTLELAASNRELEAFSYSVSHDLRAPLRAVDGFSQALQDEYGERLDEQGLHYLRRVRGACQRLGELIDDLLQLSRVTRDPMRWESIDLSAMSTTILEELHAGEPHRQAEFCIEADLFTRGHPTLMRALLGNLLGNAWKFTSQRDVARIEVRSFSAEGENGFLIRDNGAGFDMRYADKLFVPFQRLHAQEEFPGNGVGLATVQRVVNRHGGKVWAESLLDGGSVFYVVFRGTSDRWGEGEHHE